MSYMSSDVQRTARERASVRSDVPRELPVERSVRDAIWAAELSERHRRVSEWRGVPVRHGRHASSAGPRSRSRAR